MSTQGIVNAAIARSISHNEIVTIDHVRIAQADCSVDRVHDVLTQAADDHVENGDVVEYWGTDDNGHEWRVHVRLEVTR